MIEVEVKGQENGIYEESGDDSGGIPPWQLYLHVEESRSIALLRCEPRPYAKNEPVIQKLKSK